MRPDAGPALLAGPPATVGVGQPANATVDGRFLQPAAVPLFAATVTAWAPSQPPRQVAGSIDPNLRGRLLQDIAHAPGSLAVLDLARALAETAVVNLSGFFDHPGT
jgi:hypothetical protein